MSRRPRPNLPGLPFHLTARLQNREALFRGIEADIVALIHGAARAGRVRVVAYAVMPNHLHVVVVQGDRPLGRYMQQLLRCTALRVMRKWGREGHVFERRFHASPCLDADYFRNAIAYVHLNPVRASLCSDPDAYEWTSHRAYCHPASREESTPHMLAVQDALRVFARTADRAPDGCRADYQQFLTWRRTMDEYAELEPGAALPPPREFFCWGGDWHWQNEFGRPAAVASAEQVVRTTPRLQLRQIANSVLEAHAPDMDLDLLRSGGRSRELVRIRRLVTAHALHAGYANHQIARYLDVSSTTVSAVSTGRVSTPSR